jgi:hypothetical protein
MSKSLILPNGNDLTAAPEAPEEAASDISCGRCAFYKLANVLMPSAGGMCRRNPPIPILIGQDAARNPVVPGFFPMVSKDIWCGEFKSTKAERDKAS